jgi:L-asparaginase II
MSAPPVLVEVIRGGILESAHRGWVAVARADGTLVASCGDPDRVTYLRSAMKPFQAVAMVETGAADRFGFTAEELAVACASHNGEPRHRSVVGGLLRKCGQPPSAMLNGVDEPWSAGDALIHGTRSRDEQQLAQNCSGKHAAMVAACVAAGYPVAGYADFEHPHQQRIRQVVADFWQLAPDDLVGGRDMCTLPAWAAPLRHTATGWAAIADPDHAPTPYRSAIARLAEAIAAEPFMIAGTEQLDTELNQVTGGRIVVKGGAEGVRCFAIRDRGLGVSLKVEDGSSRAHSHITLAILRQLDALTADEDRQLCALWRADIRDNRDQHVADWRAVLELTFA